METAAIKKRKQIDLTPDVERMLSFLAATQGKSLKGYIEWVLEQHAREANEDVFSRHNPSE